MSEEAGRHPFPPLTPEEWAVVLVEVTLLDLLGLEREA